MTDFHFYTKFLSKLNTGLEDYIQDVAVNIISAITPVTTTMFTIYIMFWGLLMIRGTISEPILDGATRILKLSIITTIALRIGMYNSFLSNFLWNSPEALASVVASGNSDTVTNTQFLDSFLSQFFDMFAKFKIAAIKNSTLYVPDLTMLLAGCVVLLVGMLLTGYVAVLLVASKMALAILLAVGPIFVLLTMFEATKKFFDAWIGQILNFVFLVMLTSATIKLIMFVLQEYLTAANSLVVDPKIDQAVPVIVMSGIATIVLRQLPAIASALGGGIAISTLGSVGWSFDKSKEASDFSKRGLVGTYKGLRKGMNYINDKHRQNTIKRK